MRPWLVSIGVHVALLLAVLAIVRDDRALVAVERDGPRPPAPVSIVEVAIVPGGAGGHGAGGGVPADAPAPRAKSSPRARAPLRLVAEDRRGATRVGSGGGIGEGRGLGIGHGVGLAEVVAAPPPTRVAPRGLPTRVAPRSKARPARLIYPKRNAPERPGAVFVVLVTVDDEGFVAGVRLRQGQGGKRDDEALAAVFRFRYDPARDDAGRPIESRVLQRFMVD